MRPCLAAACLLSLTLAVSISGTAQAPPSADSYVTTVQPGANYGCSALLPVQVGTTSFIRLNLGALPPNSTIAKATLRLYVNAVAAPGSFDVFQVNGAWSEQGISLTTAPQLGPSATGGRAVRVSATSRSQFLLVDITALAQGWVNGTIPNHGIALALTSSSGSFSFDSKESTGTSHIPELDVVFDAAQGISIGGPSYPATVSRSAGLQPTDPYVNNGTDLQTGTSFNIDGSGTAASFNATSQYLLGGTSVLSTSPTQSLFVGTAAGQNNSGIENTFVGVRAGQDNTSGNFNTFVGKDAGIANTTGMFNTFIGREAGQTNTTGSFNSFFGSNAGSLNTTGSFNFFLGNNAGYSNTTGTNNVFIGPGSGGQNTTGQYNTMIGTNSGVKSTTTDFNTFIGGAAGNATTTGAANTFLGMNSGLNNTTGSNNVYIGGAAGAQADPTASQNVYIATQGVAAESNAIRIGDPNNQTATYVAGINGQSTSGGGPVFIDSTGKLGTTGGNVSFTQVTGTLTSPQLTGTYSNPVVLSNTGNTITGSFTGNGAGLTGVASGLSWTAVTKTANYTVQLSDFATPTTHGNYLILIGTASHTFTLPNPPPPNGYCVAIGNVADPGINSNANAYLTVNPNGVLMDTTLPGNSTTPTLPRHTSYLFCSDGTNYFRLGYQQNGVSEIGPWIKTVDTGTVNVMQTTFRNGMDFDLADGSFIFLQPKLANTSGVVTLNVNGLGAFKILKYGMQSLAPGDLNPNTFSVLIYNQNGTYWELVNPQTAQVRGGTTTALGGSLISAGTCASGAVTVSGATIGHPVGVSASDGSLPNPLIILSAAVTAANTVTVQLCAVADTTPPAKTYNIATQ